MDLVFAIIYVSVEIFVTIFVFKAKISAETKNVQHWTFLQDFQGNFSFCMLKFWLKTFGGYWSVLGLNPGSLDYQ